MKRRSVGRDRRAHDINHIAIIEVVGQVERG